MTLARLLAAALVLCSVTTFSQDSPKGNRAPINAFGELYGFPAASSSEPWKIIASYDLDTSSETRLFNSLRTGQTIVQRLPAQFPRAPILDSLSEDTVCYSIRSYVVARDSKDSDFTHAVGTSTCQPASRYHVKSAQLEYSPADR